MEFQHFKIVIEVRTSHLCERKQLYCQFIANNFMIHKFSERFHNLGNGFSKISSLKVMKRSWTEFKYTYVLCEDILHGVITDNQC